MALPYQEYTQVAPRMQRGITAAAVLGQLGTALHVDSVTLRFEQNEVVGLEASCRPETFDSVQYNVRTKTLVLEAAIWLLTAEGMTQNQGTNQTFSSEQANPWTWDSARAKYYRWSPEEGCWIYEDETRCYPERWQRR
ncbi:hypothetical protein SLS54_010269 [Diplodia seriata]